MSDKPDNAALSMLRNAARSVRNALSQRQQWLSRLIDPRRDIDYECGHPDTVQPADLRKLFARGDIARRVVSLYPEESWKAEPEIFETEDEKATEFEEAWDMLNEEHSVLSYLERMDTLSGVGRFGVMLIGLDDGLPLHEPVEGLSEEAGTFSEGSARERKVLFIRTFPEYLVQVESIEVDDKNPRFGMPKFYNITFDDAQLASQMMTSPDGTALKAENAKSIKVHWSRVVHVTDNRVASEVYGQPRMEVVLNRLLDIRKIAGGSGEMFWKGGFPGYSIESQPGLEEGDVEFDAAATREEIENYMNSMQRFIATTGMTVKSLSPQVADPRPHIESQLKLVAAAMGVPWRIFIGSEAAQLASEQDTEAWEKRLDKRRKSYITPFLIRPTIQRFMDLGVLPRIERVMVTWPEPDQPSEKEKAEVAKAEAEAIATWVNSGSDVIVPPFEFFTMVLRKTDAEARAIIDAAGDRIVDTDGDVEDGLQQSRQMGQQAMEASLEGDGQQSDDSEDDAPPRREQDDDQ
ncbi:MAG: hypothetical protein Unbinned3891contig1000_61 [Prokaryotic dsDNA virus sp.]|nr:MAG: hypothetical protein Unbinned3891contig1000_61 [Prokaryotic dsDNA virus sp.]|tara:strand:- start:58233 stop:59792 length:1560 start_codon:yes stop_codon:yes gene_type:complete